MKENDILSSHHLWEGIMKKGNLDKLLIFLGFIFLIEIYETYLCHVYVTFEVF